MSILVVENYSDSPLGLVAEEFDAAGAAYRLLRPYAGETLPETPQDYSGLVILGGAQSAVDDDEFPYLRQLAALARRFGEADRAVMGICLGAQIIARGYGMRNVLGQPVEFGYRLIAPTADAASDPVFGSLTAPTPVFHWHTDTFELPSDAVHLASSDMTPYQAFRIGRAVYGLQFHLEVTAEVIDEWERIGGPYLDHKLPNWRNDLTAQRAAHAANAEDTGRQLSRAWLKLATARRL